MIRVRFTSADGSRVSEVDAVPGARLLDAAQDDGQPLEGTCDGAMACSTCHVIVDPSDIGRLPPPAEEEEDMLDLAPGATRNSRLSCQIVLDETLDGLVVRIPPQARDARRR